MSSRAELRYEKRRAEAVVTLAGGESVRGCFFVAAGSPLHAGAERVGDLLNAEPGFFPFELEGTGGRTVLYNRPYVITVRLFDVNRKELVWKETFVLTDEPDTVARRIADEVTKRLAPVPAGG